MSRRNTVIRAFAGLACLAVLLMSCASLQALSGRATDTPSHSATATPFLTPTPHPTLPAPSSFTQAPMLDTLVQSNALPAVKDRLPEHPKVVKPVEQIGQYGGTWRMLIQRTSNQDLFLRTVAYEPLVRWTSDWSGIEPNLAERYSVNANDTEFVFTLRKGLRWSDGQPFTTADIRFWYEDVLRNTDLTPVIPAWLRSGNNTAAFEFVDDLSFKVRFAAPNSLFLWQLASPDALVITAYPAHYAKNFHARYANAADLSKRMADGGYKTWTELFIKQVGVNALDAGSFQDGDRPRLTAWVLKNPYTPNANEVIWERNPYYWKVDPQGNQLPYIDTVKFAVVQNADEAINHAINGDVDMQNLSTLGIDVAATFGSLKDSPYRLYELSDGANNVMVVHLNQVSTDKVKSQIFRNRNFRVAISYAIDRQEIIRLLFNGKGKPWQAAPREDSLFYDAEMGTQYTEYSLEKANSYLDQAGYYKDSLGKRLGPDGMPISFSIEVQDNDAQQVAMVNLLAKYWSAIGIEVQPKLESREVLAALVHSNQHDAAVWTGGSIYLYDVLLDPSNYLPVNDNAYWAIPWAYQYTGVPGYEQTGIEDAALTLLDRYNRIRSDVDMNDQIGLMKGALVMARETFWTIGIAQGPTTYGLARKNFRNVMEKMPSAWTYPDPGPANPEQFYFATTQ